MSGPVFIIAEAGVNHNGDMDLALRLVDAAKEAGADAVKFQTFLTEKILTKSAGMVAYQKENLGEEITQFNMVKGLEISWEDFRIVKKRCDEKGIMFLSTPDEEESLDFLVDELKIPWIKVGSAQVDNLPFLRLVASKKLPTILSTGMCTLGDVERAVDILQAGGCPNLVLLHCTTNYPCPMEEVNLRAMGTLGAAFGFPVGYSDHTLGVEVPLAAVALGAQVIEKHFTLDTAMKGPDHRASLAPGPLKEMVRLIRNLEAALGNGIKRPNASELGMLQQVRRKIVATRDLGMGHVLKEDDLAMKGTDYGLGAPNLEIVIGRSLVRPLEADHPLTWDHVMKSQKH